MKMIEWGEAAVLLIMAAYLLGGCGSSSGRRGVGPFDFTDYSSLDASREFREGQAEATREAQWEEEYFDSLNDSFQPDYYD